MPLDNTMTVVVEVSEMAERSDDCNGETLLAPCARKKRPQRKITNYCYWIGAEETIGMLHKS